MPAESTEKKNRFGNLVVYELNATNNIFRIYFKKEAQMSIAENKVLHPYPHPCVHQYWYIQ